MFLSEEFNKVAETQPGTILGSYGWAVCSPWFKRIWLLSNGGRRLYLMIPVRADI